MSKNRKRIALVAALGAGLFLPCEEKENAQEESSKPRLADIQKDTAKRVLPTRTASSVDQNLKGLSQTQAFAAVEDCLYKKIDAGPIGDVHDLRCFTTQWGDSSMLCRAFDEDDFLVSEVRFVAGAPVFKNGQELAVAAVTATPFAYSPMRDNYGQGELTGYDFDPSLESGVDFQKSTTVAEACEQISSTVQEVHNALDESLDKQESFITLLEELGIPEYNSSEGNLISAKYDHANGHRYELIFNRNHDPISKQYSYYVSFQMEAGHLKQLEKEYQELALEGTGIEWFSPNQVQNSQLVFNAQQAQETMAEILPKIRVNDSEEADQLNELSFDFELL